MGRTYAPPFAELSRHYPLLLHGIGRVVFGAYDPLGGGSYILANLPAYYAGGAGVPEWLGPLLPDDCNPLYERAAGRFAAVDRE